ncbi:hypothetical protein PDM91_25840 [Bacillus cereus group sp. Bc248]|nr:MULTISPECIES: hypothetical protein [Bacillus cereus group]MBE7145289.1 hypothetical protein [Bacillus paranthracis]MCU5211704.1 hypothetical protein [Bacillus paranthracis]MDA2146869.1 hypothetical protein [Bacillus cereus group sp. Bc248]HDR7527199.1 hypothetical protein [Bacillus paranthracis]
MYSLFKRIFTLSLDSKLQMIDRKKAALIKDIENGKLKFKSVNDQERVIEFSGLLSSKLIDTYYKIGKLNSFEIKVLNKILKEGFNSVSFLLLSQINIDNNKAALIQKLNAENFHLIENVGYINIERMVSHIKI